MEDASRILAVDAAGLYKMFGQNKLMGAAAPAPNLPHYFLHRQFMSDQDLLVILNTKRCRYQCAFCQLPAKSSTDWISASDICEQFRHVLHELKHSLSTLNRITLSNEGSILDTSTLPPEALHEIILAINQLKSVRTVVIETRMEFVTRERLSSLRTTLRRARVDILTGFETKNQRIRDAVLMKRESLSVFLEGLDAVAEMRADVTAYVLFKPDFQMTESEAVEEAHATISYLSSECARRGVALTIRINPMYKASGSMWSQKAETFNNYAPPRLSDVLFVAEHWRRNGVRIYLGLSTESLDAKAGTYREREDFNPKLLYRAKCFNEAGAASVLAQDNGKNSC
jgi:archaeosine synthase beta-subunit